MIITPNLHFVGDCLEAIELYKQAFDADILCLYKNEDANPQDFNYDSKYAKHVYHAEIMIGKNRVMMSDIGEETDHNTGNSVSLVVTFETAEQVKEAFNLLKADATIISSIHSTTYSSCFVSLIDRFGMRWELMTEQTER